MSPVPAIEAVALALASVPLGDPALSVSIRTVRLSSGVHVFFSASLSDEALVPFPIIRTAIRVLAHVFQILLSTAVAFAIYP